jgi:asparagine synthase (glutamine-hydrolysing)
MCGILFLSGSPKDFAQRALDKLYHRGPDSQNLVETKDKFLGFSRLEINDLSSTGNQPFLFKEIHFMCNGEIYNHKALRQRESSFSFRSTSDCEVLIPLFEKGGIKNIVDQIDGEYAIVIFDPKKDRVYAARDPMGIRPLFYGYSKVDKKICFASEVKALVESCIDISPVVPGHLFDGEKFEVFHDHSIVAKFSKDNIEQVAAKIRIKLEAAVEKRMHADAKIGFLLSGGLDSSLVCAIAQRLSSVPIKTFAIGMDEDAIDLKYAKEVADYIGSDHTEVIISREDVLGCLEGVVDSLETWDITTIRASLGMSLICKFIKEKTDVKALMTGEVSDELFGYKYTDFAPSAEEFQKEASKRIKELYLYDVLRADRCISSHSLEARVPFSDREFVDYVMSIDPKLKMNTYGMGKHLLRLAFEGDYLPESILYREKAAFSDAVGHSLVDCIKDFAEEKYVGEDYQVTCSKFHHGKPFTKESLMYRELFEKFYPDLGELILSFWMPNKEWENCDVLDPSARVLPNYGLSGT